MRNKPYRRYNFLLLTPRIKAQTMEEFLEQIKKVNRFEVIDHTWEKEGRIVVKYGVDVEVSIQDDGKTMKIFLTDKMTNSEVKS